MPSGIAAATNPASWARSSRCGWNPALRIELSSRRPASLIDQETGEYQVAHWDEWQEAPLTGAERQYLSRSRRRRRDELLRWGIRLAVVLLVFALGVAVGQALHDNPNPGQTTTLERTLSVPTSGNPGSTVTP